MDIVQKAQTRYSRGEYGIEFQPYAHDPLEKGLYVQNMQPGILKGGAVLITALVGKTTGIVLVDEAGRVLNRWPVENRLFNPEMQQWWKTASVKEGFSIDDARLLPNGDVIFIQGSMDVTNFHGQRLARMDRDGHVLWQVPGSFHHYLSLAGDPLEIYTMTMHAKKAFPGVSQGTGLAAYLDDEIEIYTMDGKKIAGWSMTDAFFHSPYRNWLSSYEINLPEVQRIAMPDGRVLYDLMHLNSVQYLDASQARALPFAQAGDLLLSFRALDALAVFRPASGQIVWARKGPWLHQHNAQVEEDGKLYLFDNDGTKKIVSNGAERPWEQGISRILRYDPFHDVMEEIFAASQLHSVYLGNYQPLGEGLWIVSSPQQGRVLVVSPEKKVLWQLRTVPYLVDELVPHARQISAMHYYSASALAFLNAKGGTR